jgi:hypothetical protein
MNSHPDLEIQVMELRRRDLLRQARLNHLMEEARRDQPRMQQRFLLLVSDLMIAGGKRLRERASNRQRTWQEAGLETGKW